jgi:hypothetical protein
MLLSFLKKTWFPILIVTLVGSSLWYYGNTKYKQGKAQGEAVALLAKQEVKACEDNYTKAVLDWNRQVENAERRLQDIQAKQGKVTANAIQSYRKQMLELLKQKGELEKKIQADLRSSTVIAPPGVRLYHDTAVSQGASPEERDAIVSRNSGRVTGTPETFEADAYASVLIQNIQEYNKLMAKYNALLDLVLQWKEIADGTNNQGASKPPSTTQ